LNALLIVNPLMHPLRDI